MTGYEIAFFLFFILIGLLGITIWNSIFGRHLFDIALFGVCFSMMLWVIMIGGNMFVGNIYYMLLSTVGLFACFSTFIIMWNYRPLHKYRTSLCYKFI